MWVFDLSLLPFSMGVGSRSASIQWRIPYSSDSASAIRHVRALLFKQVAVFFHSPSSGAIHTLPATSSAPAEGKVFWYLRSASSSMSEAHGNAALNMPVALM